MPLFKKTGAGLFSSFKHTEHSNRLRNTFEETQTFKRQLIKAELAIKAYAKATDEVLKVTDDAMTAFPRVWCKDDNIATSPNAAVLPSEDLSKPAPTTKKLVSYPSHKFQLTMHQKLEDEVYTPIEVWHKGYQQTKTRIAAVEGTRLAYDAARKDLGLAREAQLKHARKTDGKVDGTLQAQEAQAESVLAVKREQYIALEEEVHLELKNLTADAQKTLAYVSRALLLVAEALADAAESAREREAEMPLVQRQSSGPLQLGVGVDSPMGSPAGTPVGTPTYASGSPQPSFKTEAYDAEPAEQVARNAQGFKSTGGASRFGGTQAGQFDEAAAYQQQQKTSASADTSGVAQGTGKLHLGEALPAAPTHPAGGRIQDSATEFPPSAA